MPASKLPWPVVHPPFQDEAFGSWWGRLAARYHIGVDELARAAGVQIDFGDDCRFWIAAPVPDSQSVHRIAQLCRLPVEAVARLHPATPLPSKPQLHYCHRCLVVNPLDVMAPYWKASWLTAALPCEAHPQMLRRVAPSDLMYYRNLRKLLRRIGRRYTRNLYMEPRSHPVSSYASKVRGYH